METAWLAARADLFRICHRAIARAERRQSKSDGSVEWYGPLAEGWALADSLLRHSEAPIDWMTHPTMAARLRSGRYGSTEYVFTDAISSASR
jgi:hypothetical protein